MINYFFLGQSFPNPNYFVKGLNYSGYLFLGAWLFENETKFSVMKTIKSLGVFIVLSILTMIATYWYSQKISAASEIFYNYFSPLVILMAVFLFKVILSIPIKSNLLKKMINQVSLCTLGIYCIHVLVINILLSHIVFSGKATWWLTPGLSLMTLIISFVIINTMRKIKLLKYMT
jgi:surface polysaccharide O-acyltransferase-like enzyme